MRIFPVIYSATCVLTQTRRACPITFHYYGILNLRTLSGGQSDLQYLYFVTIIITYGMAIGKNLAACLVCYFLLSPPSSHISLLCDYYCAGHIIVKWWSNGLSRNGILSVLMTWIVLQSFWQSSWLIILLFGDVSGHLDDMKSFQLNTFESMTLKRKQHVHLLVAFTLPKVYHVSPRDVAFRSSNRRHEHIAITIKY